MGIFSVDTLDDSVEQKLSECEEWIEHGGTHYTFSDWEEDFIASAVEQNAERGTLTQAQISKVEEIWERAQGQQA